MEISLISCRSYLTLPTDKKLETKYFENTLTIYPNSILIFVTKHIAEIFLKCNLKRSLSFFLSNFFDKKIQLEELCVTQIHLNCYLGLERNLGEFFLAQRIKDFNIEDFETCQESNTFAPTSLENFLQNKHLVNSCISFQFKALNKNVHVKFQWTKDKNKFHCTFISKTFSSSFFSFIKKFEDGTDC